jgi:hypothetical protein
MENIFSIGVGVLGIFLAAGVSIYRTKKELEMKNQGAEEPEVFVYDLSKK